MCSRLLTGPDLRFHNDAARLIDQVHLANIDPDRPNVLFALEEHLTEETRLMLRSERENHPGNTAEIFCKALLSVARMVLSAMQSPREEPADSEQTNEQELPVPICCDASDLLIGSNFVSIVNLRVIQHLDSGFTVYDSGLGPLTGGCGHVPAPFNAKWQLHTAFVLVGSVQFRVESSGPSMHLVQCTRRACTSVVQPGLSELPRPFLSVQLDDVCYRIPAYERSQQK
ncbi:unnamed protein product [Toxocara canis]|uniref:Uncharacterized protein n=1 Tax=Toxocara canis TaxID=6265 RepID=A0A3P7GRK0_TOXCA|nr:unnamed protein product [Toxocara canis]